MKQYIFRGILNLMDKFSTRSFHADLINENKPTRIEYYAFQFSLMVLISA